MKRAIAIAAVATALIVALATLMVGGPVVTMSADGPPIPPVGSTWTYLVDYEDDINGYYEYDHPFDLHVVEHNVMPPPGVCITTPPAVNSYHVMLDTHPNGPCPGATVPTRYQGGLDGEFQMLGPYHLYASMTDLNVQWMTLSQCRSSITLWNCEMARIDYAGAQIGWPYTTGESWTWSEQYSVDMLGCPIYSVGGTETVEAVGVTVTVPAGTFNDCVYMKADWGLSEYKETWWSPTVMSPVKRIDRGNDGVATWELASYSLGLPPVGVTVTAYSPVDIVVTDPDDLTISKQANEIPGATYMETDINGDGDPDDQVIIPDRKIGDYLVTVVPEPGASPADTYTFEVSAGGETIVLAEDVQIADIPPQGYIVRSTEEGIFVPGPPPPVGGTIIPTDRLGLVMPWIIAAALIAVAGVSLAVWNRKRGAERA